MDTHTHTHATTHVTTDVTTHVTHTRYDIHVTTEPPTHRTDLRDTPGGPPRPHCERRGRRLHRRDARPAAGRQRRPRHGGGAAADVRGCPRVR